MRGQTIVAVALAFAVGVSAFVTSAAAQDWPTKTVRVIVPFSPGSAVDLVGRSVFEQVSKQVGQNIIIENRGGGGGAPAIISVKSADPDGHTILVHSNSLITTPAIQAMTWDPPKDFAGVAPLGIVPLVLVVAPEKKIKALFEEIGIRKIYADYEDGVVSTLKKKIDEIVEVEGGLKKEVFQSFLGKIYKRSK